MIKLKLHIKPNNTKVFAIVTPSILRVVTRSTSAIGGGGEIGRFFLNTIFRLLFRFSAGLLISAHASIVSIYDTHESTLHAGTII